jgi:hypothetical protein
LGVPVAVADDANIFLDVDDDILLVLLVAV